MDLVVDFVNGELVRSRFITVDVGVNGEGRRVRIVASMCFSLITGVEF